MSLDKSLQAMKFDTRLIELSLRAGTLSKEEIKKHMDQLPDLSDKCEKLNLDDSSGDAQEDTSSQQH
jgi:hypothetical protein